MRSSLTSALSRGEREPRRFIAPIKPRKSFYPLSLRERVGVREQRPS
jgi:hypothetical protein